MTTFTLAETATRSLREHGLYGTEETPSAADQEWAEQTIRSEIQVLQDKDIPIWNGGEDVIPENYLVLISLRCGCPMAYSYGLVTLDQMIALKQMTEQDLRILGQTGPTGETQQAEYF